jgi:uncharacterized protein
MKHSIILAVAVVCAGHVHAHASAPSGPSTISVQGEASLALVPDQVFVSLAVETQGPDLLKTKADNDARTKAIIALLEKEGVAKKHVQTSQVSIQAQYDYEKQVNGQPRMVGFVMHKDVRVCVTDIAKFEALLNKLLVVGGNRLNNIEFARSDADAQRAKARVEAVKNAKARATEMAAAAGMKVGTALQIEEGGANMPGPVMYGRMEKASMDAGSEGGFAAGEMSINAQVHVVYALEPPL